MELTLDISELSPSRQRKFTRRVQDALVREKELDDRNCEIREAYSKLKASGVGRDAAIRRLSDRVWHGQCLSGRQIRRVLYGA